MCEDSEFIVIKYFVISPSNIAKDRKIVIDTKCKTNVQCGDILQCCELPYTEIKVEVFTDYTITGVYNPPVPDLLIGMKLKNLGKPCEDNTVNEC